ncbi:MAG: monofunctional biosynthetic peptidoglycan transglycosylase [Betaproteobacteria bacterium]|nr:monofunctional biosynthetic peptidoglycan transglycosylase [Betaproteobacteria bacterium]
MSHPDNSPKPASRPNKLIRFLRAIKWCVSLAVCTLFLIQLWFFGWIMWWKWMPPSETRFMQIRLAELRKTTPDAQLSYRWVPYEQISPHLKRAVIASEDAHFAAHDGFDWKGIQIAMERNARKGRFVAGGSTISQQLAKNLFLSPKRSLLRKGEEAIITLMLETFWDKERILEVYLNVIEWGNGVFGVEAAAQHYYRSNAGKLSPWQSARLAAMVPNPRYYDKHPNSSALAKKTAIIQGRMAASRLPGQPPAP